jgi:GAF domain-containing protein
MRRRGAEKEKRGHKAARPKRRIGLGVTHRRGASTADLQEQLDHRTRELREALEQQTATAEILRIISSSPTDVQRVFDTIVRNFVSLCGGISGSISTFDGKLVHLAGAYGFSPAQLNEVRKKYPVQASDRSVLSARAILAKAPVHIQDTMSDPHYDREHAAVAGSRRMLAVPMLREGAPLGAIVAAWAEAGATPKQHEHLLKVFADQAVIAIENARLLNELRQRTADLSEALQRQTATSEVLRIISSSPGKLEPVFNAMLANATRICEAKFGILYLTEGDAFRTVALYGAPPAFAEARQREPVVRAGPGISLHQAAITRQPVQVADIQAEPAYTNDPQRFALLKLAGARTVLSVPMLKENEVLGVIVIYRQEVRPFIDKQIDLVKNFAAQAVIAIENTRLLNDLNKLNQQLEQRVADQVSEIERMSRLRRFLSPQVADLIVASGTEKQLESHRREITALFCDLRGFTGFSESSDPEDVMALLREYHAAIGEIINTYGGTLERYAGDGVMVVFNDPIPVDNPALQAVLMAIDMRAAIGGLINAAGLQIPFLSVVETTILRTRPGRRGDWRRSSQVLRQTRELRRHQAKRC